MKNNYVLIDYENVQPKSLEVLKGHEFKVIVFVGANQAKIPFELASALQALGSNAEYVKIGGNGPNALDFHIAFYIGQLAEKDPNGYFHIISRDTGFDPLIKHLKERKILAQREKELAEIPLLRISNATSVAEKIEAIVKSLAARGHSRPRKVKTLSNTINALFLKKLEESELEAIIEQMKKQKLIVVENENVSYKPPISQP
ncbi:PIN domain-containing protein [Haliea sp.]|uniref:PIN domain-containing protein n=1 Tax=Haliea sp. TaxID=1932666 RepID=UPI003526F225